MFWFIWLVLSLAVALVIQHYFGVSDWLQAALVGMLVGGFATGIVAAIKAAIQALVRRIQDAQEERRLEQQRLEHIAREAAELRRIERRQRLVPRPLRVPKAQGSGTDATTVEDIQLILERKDGTRAVSRIVDKKVVQKIRPVVIFQLNRDAFVGKAAMFEFIIRSPRRRTAYDYRVAIKHMFVAGMNRVIPHKSSYAIRPDAPEGQWSIEVWIGGREYARQTFSVVSGDVQKDFQHAMGADGELTPQARQLAEDVNGAISIDDILD